MNEAFEVELVDLSASFISTTFNLVLGLEKQMTIQVEGSERLNGFTDIEWQIVYSRVLVDDRWYFLPQDMYDEIDDKYSDLIGDKLWTLTQNLPA